MSGLVNFNDLTVYLTPPEGSNGDSMTVPGPNSEIVVVDVRGTSLSVPCAPATYTPGSNTIKVNVAAGVGGTTLLTAVSIVAPFDLAGYKATM
jgi:hypothetical protein